MLELSIQDPEKLQKVARALSSDIRLRMIKLLNLEKMNINQLADTLKIPVSTAASNIKVLEESGLILTELRPASRGAMKVCTRNFDDIHILLNDVSRQPRDRKSFEMDMPIGQYVDFNVAPTCGMANHEGILVPEDEPVYFYSPDRTKAQIIWTRKGFFEYKFPLIVPVGYTVEAIRISLEVCSEAPNHDHNWPSDITVWINGKEIGTWTSPGDFGDRPGKLNPKVWSETTSTQYGMLKTWEVTNEKSTIDGSKLSDITLKELAVVTQDFMSFKIGVKDEAVHKGGINLFGCNFGDYAQDIKFKAYFSKIEPEEFYGK